MAGMLPLLAAIVNNGDQHVGNQHKWDSLGPERSGVGTSLGGLPEGPVMESSPIDGLNLHLDGRGLADY